MDNKKIAQQFKVVAQALDPLINYLLSVDGIALEVNATDLKLRFEISDSGYFFTIVKPSACDV